MGPSPALRGESSRSPVPLRLYARGHVHGDCPGVGGGRVCAGQCCPAATGCQRCARLSGPVPWSHGTYRTSGEGIAQGRASGQRPPFCKTCSQSCQTIEPESYCQQPIHRAFRREGTSTLAAALLAEQTRGVSPGSDSSLGKGFGVTGPALRPHGRRRRLEGEHRLGLPFRSSQCRSCPSAFREACRALPVLASGSPRRACVPGSRLARLLVHCPRGSAKLPASVRSELCRAEGSQEGRWGT